MSKRDDKHRREAFLRQPTAVSRPNIPTIIESPPFVKSLLSEMVDGKEYGSIVGARVADGFDVLDDLTKCISNIESVRSRPCVAYVGNVSGMGLDSTIAPVDDTPFQEMIAQVPASENKLDVVLATPGGSGEQVTRFVNALRPRFSDVDFLIPAPCMSAGTLFALSGDNIWMTERACLGPIDPQVPTRDGRFVPAQALLLFVAEIQKQGQDALDAGKPVPWSAVRLIDSLDKKELGHAMTATKYATQMALEYLKTYKFKSWVVKETSRQPVTDADKGDRALEIADALASHDRWKNHGHAITRDVLWSEIRLKINHPDAELDRQLRRFWAVCSWMFDKLTVAKCITSAKYRHVRHFRQRPQISGTKP